MFLLLIHALGQLECILPQWHIKIDSDDLININMIYNNLKSEISDALLQQHARHAILMLEKSMFLKMFLTIPPASL